MQHLAWEQASRAPHTATREALRNLCLTEVAQRLTIEQGTCSSRDRLISPP
jgi:hypothetical protein